MPRGGEAENHENCSFSRFSKGFWTFKASRGILGPVAPRTQSISSYGGRTAPFRPDLMFSGPGFSCSGSPKQAWKPPEAPGSLKSSFEAFKLLLGAFQAAIVAFQAASYQYAFPTASCALATGSVAWQQAFVPWQQAFVLWQQPIVPWQQLIVPWQQPIVLWQRLIAPWQHFQTVSAHMVAARPCSGQI